MEYKFVFYGNLPGLNDYLRAERSFKNNHSRGNDMKQKYQADIMAAIRKQLKRIRIEKPVRIEYFFYEPTKRRDLDNIAAVGHKFIQDALVKSGVLKNDGWENIIGFSDKFAIDRKNPRIEVIIVEA